MPRSAPPHPATATREADEGAALWDVFLHIADRWELSIPDRCKLLGIGRTTHYDWVSGDHPPRALNVFQREVVEHVLAIDLAIQAYVGRSDEAPETPGRTAAGARPLADRWVTLPGTAPNGQDRALDAMLEGVSGLALVRAVVEARAGAPPITTLFAAS